MTITLSRRELYLLLIGGGLWLVSYVWMERDYQQMKEALEARVSCEQIPAAEGGPSMRFRYDASTGRLINVETGEAR